MPAERRPSRASWPVRATTGAPDGQLGSVLAPSDAAVRRKRRAYQRSSPRSSPLPRIGCHPLSRRIRDSCLTAAWLSGVSVGGADPRHSTRRDVARLCLPPWASNVTAAKHDPRPLPNQWIWQIAATSAAGVRGRARRVGAVWDTLRAGAAGFGRSVARGCGGAADGGDASAAGFGRSVARGRGGTADGGDASAAGFGRSVARGRGGTADGGDASAAGFGRSVARGRGGTADGGDASAAGFGRSVARGRGGTADGGDASAAGFGRSVARGRGGTADGGDASASGFGSVRTVTNRGAATAAGSRAGALPDGRLGGAAAGGASRFDEGSAGAAAEKPPGRRAATSAIAPRTLAIAGVRARRAVPPSVAGRGRVLPGDGPAASAGGVLVSGLTAPASRSHQREARALIADKGSLRGETSRLPRRRARERRR